VATIPNFYSGYLYCARLRHVIHGPHEPSILDDLRRRRSYFRIPSQYLSYKLQKHLFFFAWRNSGDKVLEGGLGNWGFRYPIACCHRVSGTSCLVFRLGIKERNWVRNVESYLYEVNIETYPLRQNMSRKVGFA
jgi:hypothetical protein